MISDYSILGVAKTAGKDEIKTAYRTLAKKWHPDKNQTKGAEEIFKKVKAAYDRLTDVSGKSISEKAKKSRHDNRTRAATTRDYRAWKQPTRFDPPTFDFDEFKPAANSREKNYNKSTFDSTIYGDLLRNNFSTTQRDGGDRHKKGSIPGNVRSNVKHECPSDDLQGREGEYTPPTRQNTGARIKVKIRTKNGDKINVVTANEVKIKFSAAGVSTTITGNRRQPQTPKEKSPVNEPTAGHYSFAFNAFIDDIFNREQHLTPTATDEMLFVDTPRSDYSFDSPRDEMIFNDERSFVDADRDRKPDNIKLDRDNYYKSDLGHLFVKKTENNFPQHSEGDCVKSTDWKGDGISHSERDDFCDLCRKFAQSEMSKVNMGDFSARLADFHNGYGNNCESHHDCLSNNNVYNEEINCSANNDKSERFENIMFHRRFKVCRYCDKTLTRGDMLKHGYYCRGTTIVGPKPSCTERPIEGKDIVSLRRYIDVGDETLGLSHGTHFQPSIPKATVVPDIGFNPSTFSGRNTYRETGYVDKNDQFVKILKAPLKTEPTHSKSTYNQRCQDYLRRKCSYNTKRSVNAVVDRTAKSIIRDALMKREENVRHKWQSMIHRSLPVEMCLQHYADIKRTSLPYQGEKIAGPNLICAGRKSLWI